MVSLLCFFPGCVNAQRWFGRFLMLDVCNKMWERTWTRMSYLQFVEDRLVLPAGRYTNKEIHSIYSRNVEIPEEKWKNLKGRKYPRWKANVNSALFNSSTAVRIKRGLYEVSWLSPSVSKKTSVLGVFLCLSTGSWCHWPLAGSQGHPGTARRRTASSGSESDNNWRHPTLEGMIKVLPFILC